MYVQTVLIWGIREREVNTYVLSGSNWKSEIAYQLNWEACRCWGGKPEFKFAHVRFKLPITYLGGDVKWALEYSSLRSRDSLAGGYQ